MMDSSGAAQLHRAPWVATGSCRLLDARLPPPLFEDGAVIVAAHRIIAVGRYRDLVQSHPGLPVRDHGAGAILMPALVNGHTHLELSCMVDLGRSARPASADPTDWIRELLAGREAMKGAVDGQGENIIAAAEAAMAGQAATGIGLVCDIGNDPSSREFRRPPGLERFFLLELLGLSGAAEQLALDRLEQVRQHHDPPACTVHAPHTAGPDLIRQVKAQASRRGHSISIHVSETEAEQEFIQQGTGPFREFLRQRGVLEHGFGVPGTTPVRYLDQLGVLDGGTLCVHAVHITGADAELLHRRQAHVCVCPGSNRQLGAGIAPVPMLLEHGILPALGTDSLASNDHLSIWLEMCRLREDHPEIAPELVLCMATGGGAAALGWSNEWGMLAPGRRADFLMVSSGSTPGTAAGVFELLTAGNENIDVNWVH